MWGKGFITGMAVTLKHFTGQKSTFFYPEEKLPMTERFRGGHLLVDGYKCIGCQLCAIQCPNKALKLTVVTDENKKRHIQRYVHHMGRCMYCDLCIEGCPVKAISWDKNYAISTWFKDDLEHDCLKDPMPVITPAAPPAAKPPAVKQPAAATSEAKAAPAGKVEVKPDAE